MNVNDFDQAFDNGESIIEQLDISKIAIVAAKPGKNET